MPRDDTGNDVTVHVVKLSSSSVEYQDVEKKIYKTVHLKKIKSIERIQNPYLYQAYQLRKVKMDRDNPQANNELQLFHGTHSANVLKINTQGFDRSFTGSAHGEGFKLFSFLNKANSGGGNRVFQGGGRDGGCYFGVVETTQRDRPKCGNLRNGT